jgi:hypothetical protein
MFSCSNKTNSNDAVSAQVADGALVVSFFSADMPKVWRIEMSRMAATALEVKAAQDKFVLNMTSAAGTEELAVFKDKLGAINALKSITTALLASDKKQKKCSSGFGKWCKRIVLTIVALLAVLFVLQLIVNPRHTPRSSGTQQSTVKTGVPVPAEQLFGN